MKKLLFILPILFGIFFTMPVSAAPSEQELRDYAFGCALNAGISPFLVISVIETESMFSVPATNGNLMQVMPQFQRERMAEIGVTTVNDPYQSIQLGTEILRDFFEEYEDVSVVLIVYNEGLAGLQRAQNGYLSNYAIKTLDRAYQLEQEYYYGGDDQHG